MDGMIGGDRIAYLLSPKVWYVGFFSQPVKNWWDRLSPEWCRHVMAWGYVPAAETWVVIDHVESRIIPLVIPDGDVFHGWLAMAYERRPRVLSVPVGDGSPYAGRVGHWCTTTTLRMLGTKSGAWRPIGLFRDLLAQGAEDVTPDYGHQDQREGSERGSRREEAA